MNRAPPAKAAGASPSDTYAASGLYTVKLLVTGSDGLNAQIARSVAIEAPASGGAGGGNAAGAGTGGAGLVGGGGTGNVGAGSQPAPGAGGFVSITLAPTATVALAGSAISINAKGAGALKLSCAGTAPCSGTLTIVAKTLGRHGHGVKIGSASFSIAAGATKSVAIKLSATGRSLLKAGHGRLSASLTIEKSSPAPASKLTRAVRLSQKG